MKSVVSFIIFAVSLSWACEKHANLKAAAVDLPENSLYQLDSKWVNENDKTVSLGHLSGRTRIVAMIYTKCNTACPLLVQDIKGILKEIPEAQRQNFHIDLFSFESANENAESLQKFKSKYNLDKNWSAYSGPESSVAEMAAALGIQYKKLPTGEYIHSNIIFLLDKNGEIIAKQEGLAQDSSQFIKKVLSAL